MSAREIIGVAQGVLAGDRPVNIDFLSPEEVPKEPKMRLVVTGDREWGDLEYIKTILRPLIPKLEVLIEGEAFGVDKLCKQAALELGLPKERILEFPANWDLHHKAAGPIRNKQMIDEGLPNSALAFHSNVLVSKGTRNMLERLVKAEIPTILYDGKTLTGTVVDKQFWMSRFPKKSTKGAKKGVYKRRLFTG